MSKTIKPTPSNPVLPSADDFMEQPDNTPPDEINNEEEKDAADTKAPTVSTRDAGSKDISIKEKENKKINPEDEVPPPPQNNHRKTNRNPVNNDGTEYTGSVLRVQNEDGSPKKRIPIQLQGLSTEMLPPITKRKVARYEVLGKNVTDPLTGEMVSPVPPLIIPGKFVIFDPFDSNVMARHKLLKNVTRSERVVRDGKDMVEEYVEDIIFDNGMKSVAIEKNFLEYVLLELHPLNESNRYRDKSQTPAFRRIDIDKRLWAESLAGLDLAYEAETAVVNMREPDKIIALAHAAGVQTAGRTLDGGPGTVKYDLRIYARQNAKDFFKLSKSSSAAVRMSVIDAKELGLVYYDLDKKAWFFSTTDDIICYVLPSQDPDKALINCLGHKDYEPSYKLLQNQLNYWD